MRTIAILNQKGGVGKTTTSVNLAAAASNAGQRVMIVDLDPQSHASLHLGIELGPTEANLYDLFVNGTPVAEIAREAAETLTLLPAGVDLVGAELEMADKHERERILQKALQPYRSEYDLCIIDCAPSLGLLTVNALVAADEVIIPLQAHFFALQGLGRLLETVTAVRESLNPQLRVAGVVMSMFERGTRLAQEVSEDVQRFFASANASDAWYGAKIFASRIRRNIKLAECPSFGQTIFQYAPRSKGAQDYQSLADEILNPDTPESLSTPPVRSADADDVAPNTEARETIERPIPDGIITAPPKNVGTQTAGSSQSRDDGTATT